MTDPVSPADRYVALLMQALLNEHGLEAEAAYFLARDASQAGAPFDETIAYDVRARAPAFFESLVGSRTAGLPIAFQPRNIGFAYTMIGRRRLENVARCVTAVLDVGVPGDLVECGVWRGGVPILMRGMLAARGVTDRTVWLADSFDGLPGPESPSDTLELTKASNPELAVSEARVRAGFERFGLLDEQVRFLPGWFKDTLPSAPIERIAVLRLDGDLYSSTLTTLTALYDKVSPGGFVIVDDYKLLDECRQAVDEFRAERGIEDPIVDVDWNAVYWRRAA
ncbi:MAG TPA: TylF/MycF/NovP-related O-methyltransferase [Solirubrobacteraceae bacterium]